MLLKLLTQIKKMFLSTRRETNPQPSDGLIYITIITIELPGLRRISDLIRYTDISRLEDLEVCISVYVASTNQYSS